MLLFLPVSTVRTPAQVMVWKVICGVLGEFERAHPANPRATRRMGSNLRRRKTCGWAEKHAGGSALPRQIDGQVEGRTSRRMDRWMDRLLGTRSWRMSFSGNNTIFMHLAHAAACPQKYIICTYLATTNEVMLTNVC